MLAARDVQLAQETMQALRAQGQDERAQAVEAVLAAALAVQESQSSVVVPEAPPSVAPPDHLTIAQAARALSLSVRTIRQWIAGGQLPTVDVDGRPAIRRQALLAYLDSLAANQPKPRPRTRAEIAAARRQYETMIRQLPADKLARSEALHEKMDCNAPLSRAERKEMVLLERELTDAAARLLEDQIAHARSSTS